MVFISLLLYLFNCFQPASPPPILGTLARANHRSLTLGEDRFTHQHTHTHTHTRTHTIRSIYHLHASSILPTSSQFNFEKLIDAMDFYQNNTNNAMIMIQYIAIKDTNISPKYARELGHSLRGKNIQVNLIPYNPTDIGDEYNFKSPSDEELMGFQALCQKHLTCKDTCRCVHMYVCMSA